MKGWKTYTAAAIVGLAAALEALGYGQWASIVVMVGGALGLAGVRHAITKAAK